MSDRWNIDIAKGKLTFAIEISVVQTDIVTDIARKTMSYVVVNNWMDDLI